MKKNTFVDGTIIASVAIIFVKILGALYVIPFYNIIGEEGGTLYSYAYSIYNLFLTISITGFPIAVAKMVSEYNEKGMFKAKEESYRISKKIILVISVISFFACFAFAEGIASLFVKSLDSVGITTISDIAFVIRIIAFSLLIIPYLSIIRGYLQGHKYIKESSNSQVIEQVVRIFIVLVGSYLSIRIFKSDIKTGVAVALSGSFFGGFITYLYLKHKINKNSRNFKKDDNLNIVITSKEIVKKFFIYAIPSVIIAIASSIYDTVDQILVIKGSNMLGFSAKDAEIIGSIIGTWGVKICMLISAVGTAISINAIPHMTESFVNNDYKKTNKKFNQILITGFVISLPMAIGVSILASPLYRLFYGESMYGGKILEAVVYATMLANISGILNTALIGINSYKIIYINTLFGIILNLILDIPCMFLLDKLNIFPVWGTSLSSVISYTLSIILALVLLHKKYNFTYKDVYKDTLKLIMSCIFMTIPLLILNKFINFNNFSNFKSLIFMIMYAVIGCLIFVYVSYKNNLLQDVFGKELIDTCLKKLHIKKEG